jgi:hypothetical protein
VALQGLWTLHSVIMPNHSWVLWLCVPLAFLIVEAARRASAQRIPTLLSQAAIYLQLMLVEAGLSQAHWTVGEADVLAAKAAIMTVLAVIMAILEIAARRTKHRAPVVPSPRKVTRPGLSAGRPSTASHTPKRNRMPRRGRRAGSSPRRRRRVANPGPPRRAPNNRRPRPKAQPTNVVTRRPKPKHA